MIIIFIVDLFCSFSLFVYLVILNADPEAIGRKERENYMRYATYLGLCIATCIILQRNVYAASVIGLIVGIYISLSEYFIANTDLQDGVPEFDFLPPFM